MSPFPGNPAAAAFRSYLDACWSGKSIGGCRGTARILARRVARSGRVCVACAPVGEVSRILDIEGLMRRYGVTLSSQARPDGFTLIFAEPSGQPSEAAQATAGAREAVAA